jgi:predicted nucleic acid-binding Zn ribbon protein
LEAPWSQFNGSIWVDGRQYDGTIPAKGSKILEPLCGVRKPLGVPLEVLDHWNKLEHERKLQERRESRTAPCLVCGSKLAGKNGSKTCSGRCRIKLYRSRERYKQKRTALTDLELQRLIKNDPTFREQALLYLSSDETDDLNAEAAKLSDPKPSSDYYERSYGTPVWDAENEYSKSPEEMVTGEAAEWRHHQKVSYRDTGEKADK